MKTLVRYIISENLVGLEQKVNQFINEFGLGWQPIGGPVYIAHQGMYIQTMYLRPS